MKRDSELIKGFLTVYKGLDKDLKFLCDLIIVKALSKLLPYNNRQMERTTDLGKISFDFETLQLMYNMTSISDYLSVIPAEYVDEKGTITTDKELYVPIFTPDERCIAIGIPILRDLNILIQKMKIKIDNSKETNLLTEYRITNGILTLCIHKDMYVILLSIFSYYTNKYLGINAFYSSNGTMDKKVHVKVLDKQLNCDLGEHTISLLGKGKITRKFGGVEHLIWKGIESIEGIKGSDEDEDNEFEY